MTRTAHACQLIKIGNIRIPTGPWFAQTETYYPGEPLHRPADALGPIDALVVSHDHYHHCDLDALVTAGFDLATPLTWPHP